MVEPTWSTRSSPANGSPACSKRFAHAASLAMKLGVAFTKAHLAVSACSAYQREAFVAPLGSRLTIISAPDCFSISGTFESGVLLICMMFLVLLPTPSSSGPLWTVMCVVGRSVTLGALFGGAKMASARSFPTLRLSMSKAATTWMSLGAYPPSWGLRSPTGFFVNRL